VIHNIHAQKQLERFLLQSHEFVDTVFDSIEESALLLLDSRLRVLKVNKAFIQMFGLKQPVAEGTRLTDIDNYFWQSAIVWQKLVSYLTTNSINKESVFDFDAGTGVVQLSLKAKLIEGLKGVERKLLVMLNTMPKLND
jgi:PAS domain-containing protein